MPPRIAYILSRFPSTYETFILREILGLKKKGFDLAIFSLKTPNWAAASDEARSLEAVTHHSPHLLSLGILQAQIHFLLRRPATYLALLSYILWHSRKAPLELIKSLVIFPTSIHYARLISQAKIAHVHAHWATLPTLAALIVSRLCDIPFSVTTHAIDIFHNTTMLEEKLSRAQFIVTCTANNRTHLLEKYPRLHQARIFVNYHGIDLKSFARSHDSQSTCPHILSVGRIEPSKGYRYLVKACALLRDRGLKYRCTIVGDGPDATALRQLVRGLNLHDCITITGVLSPEQVLQRYEAADIFVLAAVSEFHWGIPNVIIEALAMMLPVITTPLPAVRELIKHDYNAILVPEKDPALLAHALHRLMGDIHFRQRLAKNGRTSVERLFDNRKTIDDLAAIYHKWIPVAP